MQCAELLLNMRSGPMNTEWYHYFVECTVTTKSEQGGYDGVEIKWKPCQKRRELHRRVRFGLVLQGGGESTAFYPVTLPSSSLVIGSVAAVFAIHHRAFDLIVRRSFPATRTPTWRTPMTSCRPSWPPRCASSPTADTRGRSACGWSSMAARGRPAA